MALVLVATVGSFAGSVVLSEDGVFSKNTGFLDAWLRDLGHPDPFISRRGESEIRQLGDEALIPLATRWHALTSKGEQETLDTLLLLRVEDLLDGLLRDFLTQLESEYRALELDRRELLELAERKKSLAELRDLRRRLPEWEKAPGFRNKAEIWYDWRRLSDRHERGDELSKEDKARLPELERQVERLRKVVPAFDGKAKSYHRLLELESISSRLESASAAVELRNEDLRERIEEGQPRVDSLTDQLHSISLPAYAALAGRREFLPVRERPLANGQGSIVSVFFDRLLNEAVTRFSRSGRLTPDDEKLPYLRYQLAPLWAVEVDRGGPKKDVVERLLNAHLDQLLKDLTHGQSRVREKATVELFRPGKRGLDAVKGTGNGFLEGLLLWRVDPRVYRAVGVHFNDFQSLSFAARRRRVFQYARAGGSEALPTLRAIINDDKLEKSFLVKYAAAKALAAQLGDRAGILTLQKRHPEMVLKRPAVSRDLFLLQGLAFVQSKDYASAVREFLKILDEFPFDFQGNYHLAFSYLLLKDYPRAVHHFEIARRILPKDQLTLYNLACAYSLSDHVDKALEALDASIDAGFVDTSHIEQDPDLEAIRKNGRYLEILEKCRKIESGKSKRSE